MILMIGGTADERNNNLMNNKTNRNKKLNNKLNNGVR